MWHVEALDNSEEHPVVAVIFNPHYPDTLRKKPRTRLRRRALLFYLRTKVGAEEEDMFIAYTLPTRLYPILIADTEKKCRDWKKATVFAREGVATWRDE